MDRFEDRAACVIAFERKSGKGHSLICVYNFTPVPRPGYRIGVRQQGGYKELLNTDAALYGGGNMGNAGHIQSDPVPAHARSHSLNLTLPPLGALFLEKT